MEDVRRTTPSRAPMLRRMSPSAAVSCMHILGNIRNHPKYRTGKVAKKPSGVRLRCIHCYWAKPKGKKKRLLTNSYCINCSTETMVVPVCGSGADSGYDCMHWHFHNPLPEAFLKANGQEETGVSVD